MLAILALEYNAKYTCICIHKVIKDGLKLILRSVV